MKHKRMIAIIVVAALIALGLFLDKFDRSGSQNQEKILGADGYKVKPLKDIQPIEIFIKPEWIPFKSGERLKLELKLIELENTTISLQEVWNRGKFANDIYFSFHTTYHLDQDRGTFISNYSYNNDGTISRNHNIDDYILYDSNHNEIIIGETGAGPDSDFSFGVESDQFKDIRDGFYIKYTGMHLYEYSKK
ncbi:hypothetical protein [Paenibacillus montanisoli]|uniref:Uncharacterized protein n=1 Tax=Paenibacillus montanisoli TaxID=2081970 RepID=A0A328UAE7_9BACL|nr:hypothetical protein [Paenibacillus montanisoli]RAP77224.1 hypothetical protein DL346_01610 [Paenibacillus montanisoli]